MEGLDDSTVLVTGATGFVGWHLCRRLAEVGGARLHLVARRPPPPMEGATWHQVDVSEPEPTERLLRTVRPDIVFHLAGSVSASRDRSQVLASLHANTVATINVLSAATEVDSRRIVVIPSLEEPVLGGDEAVPPSPYAASKWAAGGYARMFHALYGTPVVGARIMMMYGPAQSPSKLVPYVTACLLRGEAPRIGSPDRAVDWVYGADVADGLLAAATAAGVEGRTVDLGSGTLVPIREVVEQLVELIDPTLRPEMAAASDRPLEPVRVGRADEAAAAIGWRASTPLAEGLARTVAWYRQQPSR